MLFLLCFYYTICQHFSLYHKMEKAVQEICDLKNFLLILNENQGVLRHGPSLQAIHLVIGSSQGQEFLMGSTLDDASLVQNVDTVGILNS